MRISINWLKEMVATYVDPRGIAERLTLAGLAVDTIEENAGETLVESDIKSNRPDRVSTCGLAR